MTRRNRYKAVIPKVGEYRKYPNSDRTGKPIYCRVVDVREKITRTANDEQKVDAYFDENYMCGIAQEIRFRQSNELDNVIVVDGDEGSGKSTYGLQLCYRIDPTFTPDNICYTLDDMNDILARCKGGETIMLDEAGNMLMNREFAKKGNVEFIKTLQAIRVMRINFIMILPHLSGIDKYIREYKVNQYIHVYSFCDGVDRGKARHWKPHQMGEGDTERKYDVYGCHIFRRTEDYPEMIELNKRYKEMKMEYVFSKLVKPQNTVDAKTQAMTEERNKLTATVLAMLREAGIRDANLIVAKRLGISTGVLQRWEEEALYGNDLTESVAVKTNRRNNKLELRSPQTNADLLYRILPLIAPEIGDTFRPASLYPKLVKAKMLPKQQDERHFRMSFNTNYGLLGFRPVGGNKGLFQRVTSVEDIYLQKYGTTTPAFVSDYMVYADYLNGYTDEVPEKIEHDGDMIDPIKLERNIEEKVDIYNDGVDERNMDVINVPDIVENTSNIVIDTVGKVLTGQVLTDALDKLNNNESEEHKQNTLADFINIPIKISEKVVDTITNTITKEE